MRKRSILFSMIICLIFIMFPVNVSAKESKTGNQTSKTSSTYKKNKTINTTKLTKKNKTARKAYKKLLEKQRFRKSEYSNPKYALIDLDNNGIDELIYDSCCEMAAGQIYEVYTYKKDKVKKIASVPFVPLKVYTDGTFQSSYGKTGYVENIYYRLKNGSIKKRLEMIGCLVGVEGYDNIPKNLKTENGEFINGCYWYIKKINNKNASHTACEKWIRKFNNTHKELKLKYRKNNKKNRSTMLI